MKKHLMSVFLFTVLLNLLFAGSCFASDISGSTRTVFSGWSSDFGIKAWGVTNNYCTKPLRGGFLRP